jgi:hypothetical protein
MPLKKFSTRYQNRVQKKTKERSSNGIPASKKSKDKAYSRAGYSIKRGNSLNEGGR